MAGKSAVFFFCRDPRKDPVALGVFDVCTRVFDLQETPLLIDDVPALRFVDTQENSYYFVPTDEVVTDRYGQYLPLLNQHFAAFDFAAVVNWHEGLNAPDRILTLHTTGDVPSGVFGPADPLRTTSLLLALERNRRLIGLDDFKVLTEGTHWSGLRHGEPVDLISRFPVPLLDVEIGSSPDSWSNPLAAEAVARSLVEVFSLDEAASALSLLCVGGVHLEPSFAEAVIKGWPDHHFAISHVLPNQWLVAGNYDTEGRAKLDRCLRSIKGGVDAIVVHGNLKASYKMPFRNLADRLNVPIFKHEALRNPEALEQLTPTQAAR